MLQVAQRSTDFRQSVAERRVFPEQADLDGLRDGLGQLQDDPTDAAAVVTWLADLVDSSLVATVGPRYFGFVIGGATHAATAVDMLGIAWDQNASTPTRRTLLDGSCGIIPPGV